MSEIISDSRRLPRIPKKKYLFHMKRDQESISGQSSSASFNSDQLVDADVPSPIERSRVDSFSSQLSVPSSLGDITGLSLSGLEDGGLQLDDNLSSLDFDSSSLYIGNQIAKGKLSDFSSLRRSTSSNEKSLEESQLQSLQLGSFECSGKGELKSGIDDFEVPDSSQIYSNDCSFQNNAEDMTTSDMNRESYSSSVSRKCPTAAKFNNSDMCSESQWEKTIRTSPQEAIVDSSQEGPPKKKAPRRTTKNKKMPIVDCQVCGDVAAGFYCGAFICEACKKFYMRAHKQEKMKFVCLKDKKCVITKESRVQCQACRYEKCLSLNMSYSKHGEGDKEMVMSEIPCRVCSAPSSGFHFGAITCEGCKGFFRRMAKEREPERYQCTKKDQCEINMITRNLCKSCRYHKCLDMGMSVEGSRIGRQPNSVKHAISLELKHKVKNEPLSDSDEHHTDCIKEETGKMSCGQSAYKDSSCVPLNFSPGKFLSQDKPLSWTVDDNSFTDNIPSIGMSSPTRSETSDFMVSQASTAPTQPAPPVQVKKPISKFQHMRSVLPNIRKPQIDKTPLTSSSSYSKPPSNQMDYHEFSPPISPPVKLATKRSSTSDVDGSEVPAKTSVIQAPINSMAYSPVPGLGWTPTNKKELVEGIVEAGKCLALFNYRIFDTDVIQNGKVDKVIQEFKNRFMGCEEGRREAKTDWSKLKSPEDIWEYSMNGFNHNAYITIRFAKKIPGFRKLTMNDQVKLIQAAIYPLVLLNHSRVFNLRTKQYNYFNFSKEEEALMMETFPMLTVLQDHFIHMGTLVKTHNFTNEEFNLLSALILLPSEITGLERPQDVQALQNEISEALQLYEEKTFRDGLTRYGVLLVRVAELIQCSLQHNLAVSMLLQENPTIKVPQLYQEIILANVCGDRPR